MEPGAKATTTPSKLDTGIDQVVVEVFAFRMMIGYINLKVVMLSAIIANLNIVLWKQQLVDKKYFSLQLMY